MNKRTATIFFIIIATAGVAFFLVKVFSGRWVLPQYFSVGLLNIRYYGICMALAVLAGYLLAMRRAKRYVIPAEAAETIIFWLLVGGFIGARLYHVLSSFNYYRIHPLDVLKVWNGGLSIYGALVGGVAVIWLLCRPRAGGGPDTSTSITIVLDWLAPCLALGQIIGRFGNFFNYELYGYPTGLPWKMFVPRQFRYSQFQNYAFFHPLFLYEAIINAAILFLLLKIIKPARPGMLFFWYLLLYNIGRFFLEFLRIDSTFWGTVRVNAYVSLVLAAIALAALRRLSSPGTAKNP